MIRIEGAAWEGGCVYVVAASGVRIGMGGGGVENRENAVMSAWKSACVGGEGAS